MTKLPIDEPCDAETPTVSPFRARQEIRHCLVSEISNNSSCGSLSIMHISTCQYLHVAEYVD